MMVLNEGTVESFEGYEDGKDLCGGRRRERRGEWRGL